MGKSQGGGWRNCIIRRAVWGGMQTGADRVCWGGWFWCCAWLASQSTSLWLESVLWDGSHLDRTQVIFLVPVWLSWIWDMWGMTAWLSEMLKISVRTSVSCSAQSFSTRPGILSGPAALRGLILDRVFLTSAGDRQSAWSLGGVGSFCADVLFCISNRE